MRLALRPTRVPGSAPQRLALVRLLLGLHLLVWALVDIPHLVTLYGTPVFSAGWIARTLLSLVTRDQLIALVVGALILGAVGLVVGVARRPAAVLCFVADTLLLELDPAIRSPELPLIRLLLLVLVLLPVAEPRWWRTTPPTPMTTTWSRHLRGASIVVWGALVVGMSIAGLSKITSGDPAWASGTAMAVLLAQSAWVRPAVAAALATLPAVVLLVVGFGAVAVEVGSVVVVLRSLRWPWWLASSCMHLGALLLFAIPQVSAGMLIVHLFLTVDDALLVGSPSSR